MPKDIQQIKAEAAAMADQVTAQNMAGLDAMLSIYSGEERAAFFEGALVGAFQAGRLAGMSESAASAAKFIQ